MIVASARLYLVTCPNTIIGCEDVSTKQQGKMVQKIAKDADYRNACSQYVDKEAAFIDRTLKG